MSELCFGGWKVPRKRGYAQDWYTPLAAYQFSPEWEAIYELLEEALNQGIKVVGIDKDKDAINCARENLKWFGFNEEDFELKNEDSAKVEIGKVNAMASEPDLGKILRKVPTENEAKKTLENFEGLMIEVINNLKNNINGKIVITTPKIKTMKGRKECDFEKIARETGFKIKEEFPIPEFRKNQIVGRDIVVFERN
jgi:tRNA G10  N-methylase Trm11